MIEITATGIEALTVRPTLSTRYSEEAPKTTPSSAKTSRFIAVTIESNLPVMIVVAAATTDPAAISGAITEALPI